MFNTNSVGLLHEGIVFVFVMVTLFHVRKANNDTIKKINIILNNNMNLKQM